MGNDVFQNQWENDELPQSFVGLLIEQIELDTEIIWFCFVFGITCQVDFN